MQLCSLFFLFSETYIKNIFPDFCMSYVRLIIITPGNSLVVQRLGLGAFTARGRGSIPGRGTKILQAVQHGQKNKIIPQIIRKCQVVHEWSAWREQEVG